LQRKEKKERERAEAARLAAMPVRAAELKALTQAQLRQLAAAGEQKRETSLSRADERLPLQKWAQELARVQASLDAPGVTAEERRSLQFQAMQLQRLLVEGTARAAEQSALERAGAFAGSAAASAGAGAASAGAAAGGSAGSAAGAGSAGAGAVGAGAGVAGSAAGRDGSPKPRDKVFASGGNASGSEKSEGEGEGEEEGDSEDEGDSSAYLTEDD
jgi:hypothetical protein